MNFHFLRYFSVLAEELHFGRAAARLAMTQPPLSAAIKTLETELGVQLLLRNSKVVSLTPAGAAFLDEARQILDRVGRAGHMAKAVERGIRGRLDIGVAGSLFYRGVPAVVQAYGRSMPGIEVVLHEMSTADQLQDLLHGRLDAGFVNAPTVPPQLASQPLKDDPFVVVLPENHARAQARSVALKDLAHERFVMFSREVSPANYDNVIAVFSRAGIHPQTVHAARQWLTIVAMVSQGLGVSLVPRSLAQSKVAGVRFLRFSGPPVNAPALLAWNPGRSSAALQSFVACTAALVGGGAAVGSTSPGAAKGRAAAARVRSSLSPEFKQLGAEEIMDFIRGDAPTKPAGRRGRPAA